MNRTTARICLLGGIFFLIQGVIRLVQHNDWTLAILGLLIVGFSAVAVMKRPRN